MRLLLTWHNVRSTKGSSVHYTQDNFLRGDGNRRVQHHQQQRKPRKKTKPPALTKKHKKKRRRVPRRPQKPIPPALPQGNLGMPSISLAMPSQASIRSAPRVSLHARSCWCRGGLREQAPRYGCASSLKPRFVSPVAPGARRRQT